jgi:tetratricopeptide (TPR) repeat protein
MLYKNIFFVILKQTKNTMKSIVILLFFWLGLQSIYAQKSVAIYWDASYSMKDRQLDRELEFLNNYFKKNKTTTVKLIMFSNAIILQEDFEIKEGNWDNLRLELQNTIYDGATVYSNLFKEKFDEYLMFTDGIENLDKLKPPTSRPIHIVSTLPNPSVINLKLIADLSSGSYTYLSKQLDKPAVTEKRNLILSNDVAKGYISGVIKATEGILSNVNIINKNSNIGTTSDSKGYFKIKADKGDILVFTYLGKKTVNIRVAKANIINITMANIDENLDEVIVTSDAAEENEEFINTGNVKVNKKKIGYHVETITDKDISAIDTDVEKAVAGQFSNFDLKSNQAITDFISRGRNTTILGDQRGLVVIDGAPMARGSEAGSLLGSSSLLNPDNIANITLLKGLAATNKWGSEGRNGVLLITTKNGIKGKTNKKRQTRVGTTAIYSGNAQLVNTLAKSPYITALKTSKSIDEAFDTYLVQRVKYGSNPEFYLAIYDYFLGWNNEILSERVLSNIYEIAFDNPDMLRALSYKQQAKKNYDDAIITLQQVLKLKSKQSQSYRDLALAHTYAKNYDQALKIYNDIDKNIGVNNSNFSGLKKTITNDVKNLISRHKNKLNTTGVNPLYLRSLKYKARIIFEWNNLDSEFDLSIINPQKRFFTWSHTKAEESSRIQQEHDQGYALEEFYLTSSDIGKWTFNMKYYGNYSKVQTPTYVKITIYKNFGSPMETKNIQVVRLDKKNIEQTVAIVVVN